MKKLSISENQMEQATGRRIVQDWEFAERLHDGYETVDIQIKTEEKAIRMASSHSRRTRHKCVVNTSFRYENSRRVQDRSEVPDSDYIEVCPDGKIIRHRVAD